MLTNISSNNIKSFDFFKGISCIACVFIHYNFPGTFGIVVQSLCRFAVPFFFFVSGYFFLNEALTIETHRLKKKIEHIVKLFFRSALFYMLFCVLWHKLMYSNWSVYGFINTKFNTASIVKFIITNDPFIYAHLWFLLALIYCYLSMWGGKEKVLKNSKILFALFMALSLSFSALSEFRSVLSVKAFVPIYDTGKVLVLYNLYLFRAMPFFILGIACRIQKDALSTVSIKLVYILLTMLLGFCSSIIERVCFGNSQFYIGTYFVVITFVVISLKYPNLHNKILNYIGRELSMYIYILHIAVGKSFDLIATKLHLWNNFYFKYSRVFLILIVTIMVSCIILKIYSSFMRYKLSIDIDA